MGALTALTYFFWFLDYLLTFLAKLYCGGDNIELMSVYFRLFSSSKSELDTASTFKSETWLRDYCRRVETKRPVGGSDCSRESMETGFCTTDMILLLLLSLKVSRWYIFPVKLKFSHKFEFLSNEFFDLSLFNPSLVFSLSKFPGLVLLLEDI